MAFDFKNLWKGGALGKLGDGIVAIQTALEGMKAGNSIIIQKNADNSVKISYAGPTARNGWDGKMYKTGSKDPIMNVDVTDPANLQGEYVCVNTETWSTEWADSAKTEDGWHSYHVCESWGMDVSPELFGQYYLSPAFNGSIVVGSTGGLPRATTENYLLVVRPNPDYPATSDKEFIWKEDVLRAI